MVTKIGSSFLLDLETRMNIKMLKQKFSSTLYNIFFSTKENGGKYSEQHASIIDL